MAVAGLTDSLSLRAPTMDDPWRWLQAGWSDLRRQPWFSLGYGCVFVLGGFAVTAGLWALSLESLVPALAAGFVLLGPVLAIGLYGMSRKYEAGQQATLADVFMLRLPRLTQMGFLSFSLMFLFLAWMRAATLLYALFAQSSYMPFDEFVPFVLTTPQGLAMLVIGTAIGAALALSAFAISALSVPILLERDIDAVSAMSISVRTVMRYPGPMLLWAWLIAILIGIGMATMFVGLIVVFPLVGHATWHAYRSIVATEH
jgi:uncharacterized membrane protein